VRYSQIFVENHRFNLPHLYLARPSGVTPLQFCRDLWHQKTKRIACPFMRFKILPVHSLNYAQSTRVTDGRTERRAELRLPRPR